MDKSKFMTGVGAALIIGAIYWAPTTLHGASASTADCGAIGTATVGFCLSLDLGIVSAVLRAAL